VSCIEAKRLYSVDFFVGFREFQIPVRRSLIKLSSNLEMINLYSKLTGGTPNSLTEKEPINKKLPIKIKLHLNDKSH